MWLEWRGQLTVWLNLQGYKMDDLLTSYISQMLTTMNKHRSGRGHSKWTSYWQEATELIRLLRPIGQHCSWGRTFTSHLWRMSRSPSASSEGSKFTWESSNASGSSDPGEGPSNNYHYSYDEDEPSSEDDYLWTVLSDCVTLRRRCYRQVWALSTHCSDPEHDPVLALYANLTSNWAFLHISIATR